MATSQSENIKTYAKYNHLDHQIEIYLDNTNGDSDTGRFYINPAAIVNLSIESDLSTWVTRGSLVFYYDPAMWTGGINSNTGQTYDASKATDEKINNPGDIKKPGKIHTPRGQGFLFRNDCNDLLRVRISPHSKNNQHAKYGTYNIDTNDKFWSLSYMFSIYEIEDISNPPGGSGFASTTNKMYKLYFQDIRYQKLNSTVIEYSTALSPRASKKTLATQDHSIPTGVAIKEVIEKSIAGLNLYVKQLTGNAKDKEWEDGAGSIFYTAPAGATANDSLDYIHNAHVSNLNNGTTNDFSLLMIERGPAADDVGYFTLRPMSWFFSQAGKEADKPGPYQIEHFFLQGISNDGGKSVDKKATNSYRAPIGPGDNNTDIKTGRHNTITNFRFVDSSPLINNNQFNTRPVHSFDFLQRKFNIEFKKNSVTNAREFISKKYISEVYKKTNNNPEDLFLMVIDKDKKNLNIKHTFSLYEDQTLRQSDGIQKLLYTGVFQNACIHFRAPGLPCRQIGRFIAIDRTEGVESNVHNDKFYGQWFIIGLKHVFEGALYFNEITAVKVHRYDKLPVEFLGTIDNYTS